MVCLAYGATGARTANFPRYVSVGAGFSIRNPEQRPPACFLEIGADQIQCAAEFAQFTAKIRIYLLLVAPQMIARFDPQFVFAGAWQLSLVKLQRSQSFFGGCYQQQPNRGLHHGEMYCLGWGHGRILAVWRRD
jgi:hypothetical protein